MFRERRCPHLCAPARCTQNMERNHELLFRSSFDAVHPVCTPWRGHATHLRPQEVLRAGRVQDALPSAADLRQERIRPKPRVRLEVAADLWPDTRGVRVCIYGQHWGL